MGLLGDWMRSKRMKDPVRGSFRVTASCYPPDGATSSNVTLNGIVSGDGILPVAVEHSCVARTRKWPDSGTTLPVVVDRADPSRIDIQWDEVPDSRDTARAQTAALAQAMQGGAVAPSASPDGLAGLAGLGGGATALGATTIDARGIPGLREDVMRLALSGGTPDQIMASLREHGVDLPEGIPITMVQGAGAAAAGADAATDPAARLRRLQELRRDALITEEEYEHQRAQVLADL